MWTPAIGHSWLLYTLNESPSEKEGKSKNTVTHYKTITDPQ